MDVGGCATHAVDHNTRLHRAEPRQQYRAARERRKTQKVNGDVKRRKEGRTWFAYSRSCCPRSADTLPSCVCAYWFSSRRKSSSSSVGGKLMELARFTTALLRRPLNQLKNVLSFNLTSNSPPGALPRPHNTVQPIVNQRQYVHLHFHSSRISVATAGPSPNPVSF